MGEKVVKEGHTFFSNKYDPFIIVDENGKEITVDELIDEYYSNPEAYFERSYLNNDTNEGKTTKKDDNSRGLGTVTPEMREELLDEQLSASVSASTSTSQNLTKEPATILVANNQVSQEENFSEKKVGVSSTTTLPTPFEEKTVKQVGENVVEKTPTFFKNNYCALDFEYNSNPDCFGRYPITWFSLVDGTGYNHVRSIKDFTGYQQPEKELVRDAINQIMKYDVSYGWYSTGYRNKKTGRGKDSDLKILNDAIFEYGFTDNRIVEVDNEYPYLAGIKDKTHIDLCLLYSNPIVQDNIYADRYDEKSLDAVAMGILGEGKYKGLSGEMIPNMPIEDQRNYVLRDSELTLKLAQFEEFNALSIFQHIANIVGLPLDKVCHTNASTWWEAGIEKENGAAILEGHRQNKMDYAGGFVMEPKPKLYSYDVDERKNGYDNCGFVIDVASQYPTGIINLNLSPETICCKCCIHREDALIPMKIMNEINKGLKDKRLESRDIHYWVCKERKGFIAKLIRKYRDERLEYKRSGQQSKQIAMKILINSLYGTFGQGSFAYSDYRLAEITTAFGRTVWKEMKEMAESAPYNFEPIYGDTDSVFLTNVESEDKLKEFLNDWHSKNEKIDIEIEDKKTFVKLLITGRKHYILVPFHKSDKKGNKIPILIKGMEGNKSDRPTWINKIQYELANSLNDIDSIKKLFREEYAKMEAGTIPVEDLVMKKNLGMDPYEYKNNCVEKRIGLEQGLAKGDTIRYYKGEKGSATTDPTKLSRKEYLDMLYDTFKKQLSPLGIDFISDVKNIGFLAPEVQEELR